MGLDVIPHQFDIAWCLFPKKGGKNEPGDVVRGVLLLDVRKVPDTEEIKVLAAYGTGLEHKGSTPFLDAGPDLEIDTWPAVKALNLHKPTIFSMWPSQRRWLDWTSDYFAPKPHTQSEAIIPGSLNPFQIARVKQCFRERQLQPFW